MASSDGASRLSKDQDFSEDIEKDRLRYFSARCENVLGQGSRRQVMSQLVSESQLLSATVFHG